MSDQSERPRQRVYLGALALLFVLVVGLVIIPTVAIDDGFGGVCESELGSEWEMAGYYDHPENDHYDVVCERSTGILSSEERIIAVPKSEITPKTGVERTIEFYRGVLGR